AGRAVRPRFGERVHEVPMGSFLETLQRHNASRRVPHQAFQLIPPMRWHLVLACNENPWTLTQRGPGSLGRSPAYPKPEPIRRTGCPARSPKAIRCLTEAARE